MAYLFSVHYRSTYSFFSLIAVALLAWFTPPLSNQMTKWFLKKFIEPLKGRVYKILSFLYMSSPNVHCQNLRLFFFALEPQSPKLLPPSYAYSEYNNALKGQKCILFVHKKVGISLGLGIQNKKSQLLTMEGRGSQTWKNLYLMNSPFKSTVILKESGESPKYVFFIL